MGTHRSGGPNSPLIDLKSSLETYRFTPSPKRSPRKRVREEEDEDVLPTIETVAVVSKRVTRSSTLKAKASIETSNDVDLPTPSKKRSRPNSASGSSKKPKRGFAPPEQYAHLNYLQDILKENLDVMFCGINPGCMSAEIGHHFANPTNHFWKCLHRSGFTDCLVPPVEDFTIAERFNLGLTNLVDRPSAEQAELSHEDMKSGVPALLSKIARLRPLIVCFVGKGIWEIFRKEISRLIDTPPPIETSGIELASVQSGPVIKQETSEDAVEAVAPVATKGSTRKKTRTVRRTKAKKDVFSLGIQPLKCVHSSQVQGTRETLFFVMPSTSGRVISHQLPDKVKLFEELRGRVEAFKDGEIQTTNMAIIPLPKLEKKE